MKNGLLKVPTSSRVDSKVGFLSLGTNVLSGGARDWASKSRYQCSLGWSQRLGFLKLSLTTFPKWSPGFNVDGTLVPQYTARPRELPLFNHA